MKVLLFLVFFLAACSVVAQEYAPLPKPITESKTVCILNETGWPKIADKAYKELRSWGRLEIVDDIESADLVFRFRYPTSGDAALAIIPLGGSVWAVPVRNEAITLEIFHPETTKEKPLWGVTRSGTVLVSNNAKDCIKELRKRFPKPDKK